MQGTLKLVFTIPMKFEACFHHTYEVQSLFYTFQDFRIIVTRAFLFRGWIVLLIQIYLQPMSSPHGNFNRDVGIFSVIYASIIKVGDDTMVFLV